MRNVLERALMGVRASVVDAADLDFAASPQGKTLGVPYLTLKELEGTTSFRCSMRKMAMLIVPPNALISPGAPYIRNSRLMVPDCPDSRIWIQTPDWPCSSIGFHLKI